MDSRRTSVWMDTGCVVLTALAALLAAPSGARAQALALARDGATEHAIVLAADATAVDRYAAAELALTLGQMTGAEFEQVNAAELAEAAPAIFVGLSAPALERLGESDPSAGFEDQEHAWRSHGSDIVLYGKGVHGNLNAVMAFLEEELGWRWHSLFEYPVFPERPTLTLDPFHRRHAMSFAYRKGTLQRSYDYRSLQGFNMGYDAYAFRVSRRDEEALLPRAERPFVSAINDIAWSPHALFSFVAPTPDAHGAERWPWLEKKNYFDTNPEYFSLHWERNIRVPDRQFCFSNPGLRAELTRNVLLTMERIKRLDPGAEKVLLSVAAQDATGPFCACEECKALETRYGGPGGPYYDYLFELCAHVAAEHPDGLIYTLAYRRSQTQIPPRLPEGGRLPANLVIDFAPIEQSYFADWTHPDAGHVETLRHLREWAAITHPGNLWAWLYPNPWGTGLAMPVGNVQRLVNTMRTLHECGVRGVFTDHSGLHNRAGWTELQAYLFHKLGRDVNADAVAIVHEFTDFMYGAAAATVRDYLGELEAARYAMTNLPPAVTFASRNYDDATFPYLTPENIHRWQGYFDEMTAATRDGPLHCRNNVRLLRRPLDLATLWKWFDLRAAYPAAYPDHTAVVARFQAANATEPAPAPAWETKAINRRWSTHPLMPGALDDFVILIEAGGIENPLPAQFDGIDPRRVQRLVPQNYGRSTGPRTVPDPEAAFGYAVTVHAPDMPFHFGFYPNDKATNDPDALPPLPDDAVASWERALNRNFTLQRGLNAAEITPGAYQVFRLGEIEVTRDCIIWFSAQSWGTHVQLGHRLYEPGADNRWDAYVSLKFDGPSYGGDGSEDQVLVGQVILIADSLTQFE